MKEIFKEGYSFFNKKTFSECELKKMATNCGDMNFIHHDNDLAAKTRFSGIIASGSAIAALFSAMIPTHFSEFSPILGLEMSFKFPAPIKPDVEILMTWEISDTSNKKDSSLILNLNGVITDKTETVLVAATAQIILLQNL
jgi:acyl dehydratase